MFVKGFRQRERIRPEIGIDVAGGCVDSLCHSVLCAFEKDMRRANKNGRHWRPSLQFTEENSVRKRIRAPCRNPAAA